MLPCIAILGGFVNSFLTKYMQYVYRHNPMSNDSLDSSDGDGDGNDSESDSNGEPGDSSDNGKCKSGDSNGDSGDDDIQTWTDDEDIYVWVLIYFQLISLL